MAFGKNLKSRLTSNKIPSVSSDIIFFKLVGERGNVGMFHEWRVEDSDFFFKINPQIMAFFVWLSSTKFDIKIDNIRHFILVSPKINYYSGLKHAFEGFPSK